MDSFGSLDAALVAIVTLTPPLVFLAVGLIVTGLIDVLAPDRGDRTGQIAGPTGDRNSGDLPRAA